MRFDPRTYQAAMIDHTIEVERGATLAGMGTGKTSSTLIAAAALDLRGEGPTLVIAPKRVAQSTWPDEAAKWDQLAGFDVVPIVGTLREREAALRRPFDLHTTNYEQLPWLVEHWGDRWPYRNVIPDEATRLKGFRSRQGTKRARVLASVAHSRVARWRNLTGTPTPNGLTDLWGQMWFVDRGERLGRTFSAFAERWFRPDWSGYNLEPLPHAQAEIESRIADVCFAVDARDHFDLHEPIVNTIAVELPAKARDVYRNLERKMFAELGPIFRDLENQRVDLNDKVIDAPTAAALSIKCLQVANGAVITDESGAWSELHDAKLQALDSVIAEAAGAPVLVAYHFRSDLARLLRTFPQGRHLDDDPATIRAWNAGRIPVLFAHPASAGHGLNLQDGGNILVVFGHWWDLEQYQQIVERIGPTRQAQAGHDRPVFIHHIVARDTVDEIVIARRASKASVQDALLAAMKGQRVSAS